MIIRTCTHAFIVMTLTGGVAGAQQASEHRDDGPWSGSAELSLVATSGNSNTRTFGLGGEVTYAPAPGVGWDGSRMWKPRWMTR